MNIEKNHVDISRLFDYKTTVTFSIGDGKELDIHLKLVGDADFNKAKVIALRDTSFLRENLENIEWENRRAYIPAIRNKSKEHIIETIALLKMREIGIRVTLETQSKPPFSNPTEPKPFAPIKDKENFQAEVDSFPEKIKKHISTKMQEELNKLKASLFTRTKEELLNYYERLLIEESCESYFKSRLEELVVFFSIFLDENYKIRVFNETDLELFDNLPTQVKQKLMDAYSTIDLPGEELKK